jgi:hypothetical protein
MSLSLLEPTMSLSDALKDCFSVTWLAKIRYVEWTIYKPIIQTTTGLFPCERPRRITGQTYTCHHSSDVWCDLDLRLERWYTIRNWGLEQTNYWRISHGGPTTQYRWNLTKDSTTCVNCGLCCWCICISIPMTCPYLSSWFWGLCLLCTWWSQRMELLWWSSYWKG